MVNFKVRFKNPVFIAQFILAIFTPILAYAGLTAADLTTWKALGDLIIGAVNEALRKADEDMDTKMAAVQNPIAGLNIPGMGMM